MAWQPPFCIAGDISYNSQSWSRIFPYAMICSTLFIFSEVKENGMPGLFSGVSRCLMSACERRNLTYHKYSIASTEFRRMYPLLCRASSTRWWRNNQWPSCPQQISLKQRSHRWQLLQRKSVERIVVQDVEVEGSADSANNLSQLGSQIYLHKTQKSAVTLSNTSTNVISRSILHLQIC